MRYTIQDIDKYLNGEFPESEVKAFEEQMRSDKDFAYEVKLHQMTVETVQYSNFMDKVEGVRQEIAGDTAVIEETAKDTENIKKDNAKVIPLRPVPKGNTSQSSGFRWLRPLRGLAAAAMIALLIWLFWPIDPYTHYVLDTTQMSSDQQELQQAQEAYNSKKYAEALPIFEKYPDNTKVQLAKGNAEYNLEKFDAAIATFQKVASGNSEDKSTANWYLALTYLKQEQPEKAKAALKEIKSGKYDDDAEELFKKIK